MVTGSDQTGATGNHPMSADPDCCTIHQLFEAQVQQNPQAIAVIFGEQVLTYQALEHCANRLAHHLQTLGVGPEVLVGICLERSLEMVVAMLAILKAGGAYVPLDPTYPGDRLTYMIQDANLKIVVTQASIRTATHVPLHFPEAITLVCLDRDADAIYQHPPMPPLSTVTPSNLAYIIYTSGSTGKPKGVQIMHHSVVNLLGAIAIRPGFTHTDTSIAVTTISFDVSVPEIYGPLTVGGQVVIASQDATKDPQLLMGLIDYHQATVMSATPTTWQMLLNAGWGG